MKRLFLCLFMFGVSLVAESDVTVYQNAAAEVEEQQTLTFTQGVNTFTIPLPEGIKLDSLFLDTKQNDSSIVSYRTKRAVTTSFQLLNMYVGKEVGFRLNDAMNEYYKGTLLSLNPVMILHDEEVYFDIKPVNIKVPYKAFAYEPEVVVTAEARKNTQGTVGLYYQLQGIRWQCRYMLERRKGEYYLTGWAEIYSGLHDDLDVGSLKLVAGDVHQGPQHSENMLRFAKAYDAQTQNTQTEMYQIYEIYSVSTLYAQEFNSVELISMHKIDAEVTLVATFSNPMYALQKKSFNPMNVIQFTATRALPSGNLEVYDADKKLMLGEDRVNNAPQSTPVEVKVGGVYDIRISEVPLKLSKEASKKIVTVNYEIVNASNEEKTVVMKIPFLNQNNYNAEITGAVKHYFESADTLVIVAKVSKENSHTVRVVYSFPTK